MSSENAKFIRYALWIIIAGSLLHSGHPIIFAWGFVLGILLSAANLLDLVNRGSSKSFKDHDEIS